MSSLAPEVAALSNRFLLRFSYIGTRYKGLQRQSIRSAEILDQSTIQAVLENALNSSLKLQYPAGIVLSSRTDKHVHAHTNVCHVDLIPFPCHSINPNAVTHSVNRYLRKVDHAIVLRETIRVPRWFHSRAEALRRKYVYRVAIQKNATEFPRDLNLLPLIEYHRCLVVHTPVDIEKVQRACELFEGFHDFETFQSVSEDVHATKKHMEEVTFVPDHDSGSQCEFSAHYNWWKFNVTARSFLYRQVRRIVSAALSVGQGRIPLEKVSEMLHTAHKDSWGRNIPLLHGHGLYLADMEYDARMMRPDIPPPSWRPPMPFLGKHGKYLSRSTVTESE